MTRGVVTNAKLCWGIKVTHDHGVVTNAKNFVIADCTILLLQGIAPPHPAPHTQMSLGIKFFCNRVRMHVDYIYACICVILYKGSPTVAKSRTPYLKSHLKSLKSLKFQNLKSRTVETVISKFLYIFVSNIKQALSKGN